MCACVSVAIGAALRVFDVLHFFHRQTGAEESENDNSFKKRSVHNECSNFEYAFSSDNQAIRI